MFKGELSKEEIQRIIKEYTDSHGWGSFFGLIAQIAPQKVDQEDLKQHKESIEMEIPQEQIVIENPPVLSETLEIKPASIYAEEHIPAVEEDLREQSTQVIDNTSQTKTKSRVLEQVAPNPWGDAKIVSPGDLNL